MNPFEFVNNINAEYKNRKQLMRGTDNDTLAQKGYSPFLVNRAFSYYADTIGQANMMNLYSRASNVMQYEYLLNTIRPRKRYASWQKKDTHAKMELVKEYFGYNDRKAIQVLPLLTKENMKVIKATLEKGGKMKEK